MTTPTLDLAPTVKPLAKDYLAEIRNLKPIVASRAAVLDRLLSAGFTPGLTPARHPIGRMHQLLPKLLDAFGDTH